MPDITATLSTSDCATILAFIRLLKSKDLSDPDHACRTLGIKRIVDESNLDELERACSARVNL